ncbi:MAG: malonic semialdehyde reductase [Salinarimonadaceae bacterium]|nr:MAG: malonic semialdehyde reductase [Salinarimonadaceae bacterium]
MDATRIAAGTPLPDASLDQLFREARTLRRWRDQPVSPAILRAIADLTKMGPTSANCSPARIVFVVSPEAKARLEPHLSRGNRRQTMSAPATAIIGYDLDFYEKYDFLHPHDPAGPRSWVEGKPDAIARTALQNGSLQGAYLIMAARALGLDCGPMGGFDAKGVEEAFFPGGRIKANFLCNLGYGDRSDLRPRLPRFAFEDFCEIA